MYKTFSLLLFSLFLTQLSMAQGIAPNSPTKLDTTKAIGKLVQILSPVNINATPEKTIWSGNVFLRQDNTYLKAGQVIEYRLKDEVELNRNVWIAQDDDTLRTQKAFYNAQTKVARATGNLRISNGKTKIKAPSGKYFSEEKKALFEESVTLYDSSLVLKSTKGTYWTDEKRGSFEGNFELRDSSAVLHSDYGNYWSDEKRAEFYDNVQLEREDFYLESDTLQHFRETEESFAFGNVFAHRFQKNGATENQFLFGERIIHNDTSKETRLLGNPLLIQFEKNQTESDTLIISSNVIQLEEKQNQKNLVASIDIQILRKNLAAKADSLFYSRTEVSVKDDSMKVVEMVHLFKNPIIWYKENQITGDSMRVRLENGQPDSLWVNGNVFVSKLDSSLNRVSQLKSQKLEGTFAEDDIESMKFIDQAEMIYYLEEEGTLSGAYQVSSNSINLFFSDDEISRFEAGKEVSGNYYDAGIVPSNLELQGFNWQPENRPTKQEMIENTAIWEKIMERIFQISRKTMTNKE